MLKLAFALLPVILILLFSEYLWRKKIVKGERARKFIHILAGIWMAFWPHYLPFDGIFILGCIATAALIYSRATTLIHAIYAVKRKTYGEIFFAMAIAVCAYIAKEPWIFTLSLLLLSLADGGAAVVGRLLGIKNQYFVFWWPVLRKSVAGTAAYIGLAYLCVFIAWLVGGEQTINENMTVTLLLIPLGAAVVENVSPYGLDNLATPLFTTLILNSLI